MLMTDCAHLIDKTLYLLTLLAMGILCEGCNTELILKYSVCHSVVHKSSTPEPGPRGDEDFVHTKPNSLQRL